MSAAYWALRAKHATDGELAMSLFDECQRLRQEIKELENQVELQRLLRFASPQSSKRGVGMHPIKYVHDRRVSSPLERSMHDKATPLPEVEGIAPAPDPEPAQDITKQPTAAELAYLP